MSEDLYKKYTDMYREFTKINDFNLKERAHRIPAEKHFWVEKLMDAKRFLIKLEKKRKKLLDQEKESLILNKKSPVSLEKKTLDSIVTDALEKLNDDIADQKLMVEFLERTVSNVSFIAQDMKNIIETIKLENE